MASFLNLSLSPLFFLLMTIPFAVCDCQPNPKSTHLHFYLYEINKPSPNATAVIVATRNSSAPASFGDIAVFDDALREGPEPTSKLIGRGQGIFPQASLGEPAFLTAANLVFTDGEYSGSTIAVLGRAVFSSPTRELSIVGGTGQFRLATGYVVGTSRVPPAGYDLFIEFDAYVTH